MFFIYLFVDNRLSWRATLAADKILTRARVAVSATFAMVGGAKMTPPLTRKLG